MPGEVFILGVDPGFASFGVAVVQLLLPKDEVIRMADVIRTQKVAKKQNVKAADDNSRRAQELAVNLRGLIEHWKPTVVAAEAMSFPRNASAAAKVAMAWGVLATLCATYQLPLVQATPQEIKKTLCKSKAASKEEVQIELETRYPQQFSQFTQAIPRGQWEHGFDAAGAAISCLDSEVVRMARRMAGRG